MTLRAKIILAIIIGLCAIILLFVGIVAYRLVKGVQPSGDLQNATSTPLGGGLPAGTQAASSAVPQPVVPVPEATTRTIDPAVAQLIGFVFPFVERFGTYTNQGYYENLSDVFPLMTPTMRAWAQQKIADSKGKPFPVIYQGTTTHALAYTVNTFTDSSAVLVVGTQRKDLTGTTTNAKIYTQDITVTLVKTNGQWLIDKAEWK